MSDTKEARKKFRSITFRIPPRAVRKLAYLEDEAKDLELAAVSSYAAGKRLANQGSTLTALILWADEQDAATKAAVLRRGFDLLNALLTAEPSPAPVAAPAPVVEAAGPKVVPPRPSRARKGIA